MRAVLERDFVSQAIRPRAYLLRVLVAGGALAVLLAVLNFTPRRLVADRLDLVGTSAFQALRPLLLGAAAILTPALLVGTMLVERREGNLAVLLTTPISGIHLAAGKFLSRAATVLGWIAATLPVLTVAVLFGGVSIAQVALVAATTVGIVLETGAWALVVSTFTGHLATAAVLVYLVPLARWFLTLRLLVPGLAGGDATLLGPVLATPLPGAGAVELARVLPGTYGPDAIPSAAGFPSLLLWPGTAYLLFAAAAALLAVLLCGFKLAREEEIEARLHRRRLRIRTGSKWRARLTGGNPVAWKESLMVNAGGSRALYYLAAAVLVGAEIGVLSFAAADRMDARDHVTYVAAVGAGLAILAAINGATSMVHERTAGTLELLRITPLSPREIVAGKILGLSLGLGWLLLVPMFHLGLMAATGLLSPWTAVAGAVGILVGIAAYGIIGVRWGILSTAPWAAVAGAVVLPAFGWMGLGSLLCVGPPVLVGLALTRGRFRDFAESIALPGFLAGNLFQAQFWFLLLMEDLGGRPVGYRQFESLWHGTFQGALFLALQGVCFVLLWLTVPGVLALEMERLSEGRHVVPRSGSEWAQRAGWRG